ncbi:MAG: hypothetical protein M3N82_00095 [Pseudomonadota bacterium]|nr:hypothetical protein [Pseudomonadota bacterium]
MSVFGAHAGAADALHWSGDLGLGVEHTLASARRALANFRADRLAWRFK